MKKTQPEPAGQRLVEVSRLAAMNEVATGVLHHVGNVLTSVNVSVTLLRDNLGKSRVTDVGRLADLLRAHQGDLASFLTQDSKGSRVLEFLGQLAMKLHHEQATQARELESLQKNLAHLKEIVTLQQDCSKISGLTEVVQAQDLIEDTLRLTEAYLTTDGVELLRDFADVPPVTINRHKVLPILMNLIQNAHRACREVSWPQKRVIVSVRDRGNRVEICVADNGIGIPPENLQRIFEHGFTTKKDGHGFGLHSGAQAAKEIGGTLTARSAGVGQGAVFTLELPIRPLHSSAAKAAPARATALPHEVTTQ